MWRSLSKLGLITIAGMLAASIGWAQAGSSRVPTPAITPARAGTECIADPATMRREHPAMLKHQRDQTVHGGIRGAKASLKGCVSCHSSPTSGSVASTPTDFCASCHSYAAVQIDCFECHASKPSANALHRGAAVAAGTADAVREIVRRAALELRRP